jgi:alanyl-tRNA synthetase
LTSNEIRRTFLNYFASRGHRIVRSSSLVPANDPTLLFTNAGMNQFKDVFLGLEQREYKRATSSQKCVRAGGKHNDLENVGRTRRHLTFFEMLGNFSFGDYFKKDAIEYAWELVTGEFKLPADKLYVTVFGGGDVSGQFVEADEVARGYWKTTGVSPDRIFEGDVKDNFWAMGDTGPCGPCSEIYYDLGPEASTEGHTDCAFPCECDRYVEIWNLVFMQFNRNAGGSLAPLPRPSIDTGMGLERMTSVVQGKLSVFETDLLRPLIEEAAEMAATDYGVKAENDVSLRILADHSRASAFLIHDSVLPANEGRGYVLRKIMRRAIRHGRILGLDKPFLYQLTGKVAELMAEPYPELMGTVERIAAVVKSEELRFAQTMTIAIEQFEQVVKESTATSQVSSRSLPGDKLFRLYDTFGMPLDWIKEMADERGLDIDEAGFDAEMQRQRERARASWKGGAKEVLSPAYTELLKQGRTVFEGYQQMRSEGCVVRGIVQESQLINEIPTGAKAEVMLDHTPFYAASGGQIGDTGVLLREGTDEQAAIVEDTYSPVSGIIAHRIVSREPIRVGDRLTAVVDASRRDATRRNHTATHLLHAALRQVLGAHVKQAGSVVEPNRLRFDFSHFAPVEQGEIEEIERLANAEILRNTEIQTNIMELDQALETGAMAFFGEKYPERVRVVSVSGFSKELCGGTHVSRTGDIGVLKIVSEGGISAGVRRMEAVTGTKALEDFEHVTTLVHRLSSTLKTSPEELPEAVEKLAESERNLAKQVETLRMKIAQAELANAEDRARSVKDVKVLTVRVDALERGQMRSMADVLRQRLKSGVVVLGSASDGKVALIAAITPDLTKRLHAGKIAQAVAQKLGGTGGGRPDMAEAGGKNATQLDSVLAEVYDIVDQML